MNKSRDNAVTLSALNYNLLLLKFIKGIGDKFIFSNLDLIKNFKKQLNIYELNSLIKKQRIEINKSEFTILQSNVERVGKEIYKNSIRIININDDIYPISLKKIFNPPVILFYKGDIEYNYNRSIAVVGTRKYSKYGELVCNRFVNDLSDQNFTIISGLAAGIDSIAHKKGLDKNAKCIGVIGNGLNLIYPSSNKRLYERLLENNGCIISEFVPWQEPYPSFFPMRNRIIAGLAKATLVIEAAPKSGSLITAKYAFNENREVYAVPSDITFKNRAGSNEIIRDGIAKLITEPLDIINDLGINNSYDLAKECYDKDLNVSELAKNILKQLSIEHLTIENLSFKFNQSINELSAELTELELQGKIQKDSQGKWVVV